MIYLYWLLDPAIAPTLIFIFMEIKNKLTEK